MFVLDGFRRNLPTSSIEIPSFHRGHLGFVRGIQVNCRAGGQDPDGSQELTLTPFQGSREDLFLLRCVFREKPGVVLEALSALAALNINVLSLESATINGGANHVLFCILSWSTTKYRRATPMDEGMQQKFVQLLPLLPNLDERYLLLLEVLFLFCGEKLDHDELARRQPWVPKVHMTLYDALQEAQGQWDPVKLKFEKARDEAKASVDVAHIHGAGEADVILLSETETKTLRLILPGRARRDKFLHIAFHHTNRPGALLAIATLLRDLGFSIITSLLRKSTERADWNVWETILEYQGNAALLENGRIAPDFPGVEWFKNWAFNRKNLQRAPMNKNGTRGLVAHMKAYDVGVSRPSYPRKNALPEHFKRRDILENFPGSKSDEARPMVVEKETVDAKLQELLTLKDATSWGWLAKLFYADLCRRRTFDSNRGTVFVSLPTVCKRHLDILERELFTPLGLKIDQHLEEDSRDIATTALDKIGDADFFFSVWHPDPAHPGTVSPWIPFEYGAARTLGKRYLLIYHADLPIDVKRRIDPSTSGIQYDDLSFRDLIPRLRDACERNWFQSAHEDLSLSI